VKKNLSVAPRCRSLKLYKYVFGIIYVLAYFSLRYGFNVCDGGFYSTVSDIDLELRIIFQPACSSLFYSRFNTIAFVCVSSIFLSTWH
jgi:hypothetical protein